MTYFLPNDIARCSRDDCPLHLECARWLDVLPMEEYWYSQFEPKVASILLRRKLNLKRRKMKKFKTKEDGLSTIGNKVVAGRRARGDQTA